MKHRHHRIISVTFYCQKDSKDKSGWDAWGLCYGSLDNQITKSYSKKHICSHSLQGMKEDDVSFESKVTCDKFWKK